MVDTLHRSPAFDGYHICCQTETRILQKKIVCQTQDFDNFSRGCNFLSRWCGRSPWWGSIIFVLFNGCINASILKSVGSIFYQVSCCIVAFCSLVVDYIFLRSVVDHIFLRSVVDYIFLRLGRLVALSMVDWQQASCNLPSFFITLA